MAQNTDCQTLAELFERSVNEYSGRPCLGTRCYGTWVWHSYAQVSYAVSVVRTKLAWMGVTKGDRVAIIANNRLEWVVMAYACYSIGAVFVPMYEQQSEKDWSFIIHDCTPKVIIVANSDIRDRVMRVSQVSACPEWVVTLEDDGTRPFGSDRDDRLPVPRFVTYKTLQQTHLPPISILGLRTNATSAPVSKPDASDLACLIYTSGTTGNPKGVMLTHGNVASNIEAVRDLGIINCEDVSLSFLPWAHVFGHTAELQGMFRMGGAIAICEGVEKILGNLAEVKPTVLFTVPSIFNKVYAAVQSQVATKPRIVQNLFQGGLAAAQRRRETGWAGIFGYVLLLMAGLLIFSKARKRFGGRLRLAVCGGAALAKDVGEFIDTLGIPVYEGYGMTESSPIATVNYPGNRRLGTGGKAIRDVNVSIDMTVSSDAQSGEIVIRGPNVMRGYYNLPDETAKTIQMGTLRTGDAGYLDEEGYLHVTGRINEQYKLENGKFVAPGPLEDKIRRSPLVANVMVYGLNKPHNVALVVPNMDALKARLNGDGHGKSGEELLRDPKAQALMLKEVQSILNECKGYERVKRVALLGEDFTQQNGLLTPTLKVKRRKVVEKWSAILEGLYT